jgi:hypothetical protein
VNNMKQSGTTIVFVLVCIVVLVASYGIGLCVREVRFSGVKNESVAAAKPEKPAGGTSSQAQAGQTPGVGGNDRAGNLPPEQRTALTDQRAGMRQRFENMTDAEREAFRTQMRDRFGGGRRGMGSQLSDEDRAKMREELDSLRAKWDQMSDEEKEKASSQFSEKYGFAPRIGSGRGFGGGEGGRQRSSARPDDTQQSDNN